MAIVHFSHSSDGGAGRAGRRASLACGAAGLASSFAFVIGTGAKPDDIQLCLDPDPAARQDGLASSLHNWLQWDYLPQHRTDLSNTLFSVAYPGVDVATNRVFETADIVHLHWSTWGITPRAIADMLAAGRTVFWTLHDLWPMTGGCHYPAGCEQFRTICVKCPQLDCDCNLVTNSFVEKQRAYATRGNLWIVTPSAWMAEIARSSAIFRDRRIEVVPNSVELEVFAPRQNREALRAAFGIAPRDFVLLFASYDVAERRKGVRLLLDAVQQLAGQGEFRRLLPAGATVHLAVIGKSAPFDPIAGVRPLTLGTIADDEVLADVLAISDVVGVPSLEDNYPNIIVEAMACGTPCLGFAIGGVAEMIDDGRTGILVEEAGSVDAMSLGLVRFMEHHLGSTAMRRRCRAAARARNDPRVIGRRLRALYEEALGHPLGQEDSRLRSRVLAAFAKIPTRPDASPGADLLQFPLNSVMAKRLAIADRAVRNNAAGTDDENRTTLLTVRTYHEHHAAHSGPYQFIRHLDPAAYTGRHIAVPLGASLGSKFAAQYQRAGALMGVPAFASMGNAWLAEADVLLSCTQQKVDLVHFIDGEHNGWLLPNALTGIFRGRERPKILATYHQPPAILAQMVNSDLLRRHDAVIALCETQRALLARHVDASRVFVVPHGVDTEFFRPAPQPAPRGRSAIRLLLVGHWLRDLAVAMSAYAALRSSGVTFELTIISSNFPIMVDDPSIRVVSGLTDEALRSAYWDADLLFLPLVDATANNAILEAMACSLPVVSTNVGGVSEAVDAECGVLCDAGAAEAFAAATLRLARSPERRSRMARAARARAELYRWPEIAHRHDEVYKTVLSHRRETPERSRAASPRQLPQGQKARADREPG